MSWIFEAMAIFTTPFLLVKPAFDPCRLDPEGCQVEFFPVPPLVGSRVERVTSRIELLQPRANLVVKRITGWWQLKYFLFSPRTLGKMNPFWRSYFSNGLKPIIVNLVNHHKDPYQTTRIQWRVRVFAGVFRGSFTLPKTTGKTNNMKMKGLPKRKGVSVSNPTFLLRGEPAVKFWSCSSYTSLLKIQQVGRCSKDKNQHKCR